MPRTVDSHKLADWRFRFEQFDQDDRSVAEFCDAEGVSSATYYYWRRRVAQAARSTGALRPVRIVDARPALAVVLPNGARIEVVAADGEAIRAVIRECMAASAADGS